MRLRELPASVRVAHEVGGDDDAGAEDLAGNVPARADDAENHAGGEDEAEGEDHQEDVRPEDPVQRVWRGRGAFGDLVVAAVGEGGSRGEEDKEGEQSGGEGEEGS